MPLRVATALVLLFAFFSAGCSTTLSTLQPAEPMRPGHVQAQAALNVNVPASRIVDAVDVVATLGDRYVSDPSYKPTTEEQRQALAAGVGLGLSAPGVNPDFMLRMGVVKDLDVGLRWSGLAAHADAKYRFLSSREPSAEEEEAARGLGNGPDRGFQGAVSIGISKALYSGFVFDAVDYLEVGDYSRWNVEVPVIFGSRLSDFGHVWFGPKYVFSTYSVDASLQNIGIVPRSSGTIHHLGAFGGIGVGYKVVFVFTELTIAKMLAEPEIFGQKTDLGGIVVVPAGGLMLRL